MHGGKISMTYGTRGERYQRKGNNRFLIKEVAFEKIYALSHTKE